MIGRGKCACVVAILCLATCRLCAQDAKPRTIHVFVALADNQHQGIVPVAAVLGNGEDPERNLYWGSAYGVKTYFSRSAEWERLNCGQKSKPAILERCIFKYRTSNVYLIADAYRGIEIKQAVADFLDSAAGGGVDTVSVTVQHAGTVVNLPAHGGAALVAYIGHDGLMDFQLPQYPHQKGESPREAIVLACASKQFFAEAMRANGAYPLLWTTGLMAPEAYTLKAALDGWVAGENRDQVRDRAAAAYDKYQKCGFKAAHRLLTSGW